MKKSLCSILLFFAFLQFPTLASASEAPIILSHQLTSSVSGSTEVTLNYTVYLQNTGESGIVDLDLSLVPLPPFLTRELILKLPFLGPGESAELELALLAPQAPDVESVALAPLHFNGKYSDAQGRPVEFPVASHPRPAGGVK